MSEAPIMHHVEDITKEIEEELKYCALCLEVPPMKGWNICRDCYRAIRDGEEIDLEELLK